MKHSHASPTLLVFTLGPSAETRRRPLLPGPHSDLEIELRRTCLAEAVAAGREAGCRIEISSPRPPARLHLGRAADGPRRIPGDVRCTGQRGSHFGARLDAALRSVLRRGAPDAPPVVVVGTDVPDLTGRHVRRALELLDGEPDRVVVGPSPDGGFYLLAASRPIEGLASDVSWCSRRTLATLRRLLEESGRELVLMGPLVDLDRPADLERWLAGLPGASGSQGGLLPAWRPVVLALARRLARLRRPRVQDAPGVPVSRAQLAPSPRGPPVVAPSRQVSSRV